MQYQYSYQTSSPIVTLIALLFSLVLYAYMAFSLQTIARKTNTENGWLAWIPIANIYLMIKIAGKPGWWLLLILFIPLVNLILFIILWMKIAEARGKPGWLGILFLIPIVNLILPGYLAFTD